MYEPFLTQPVLMQITQARPDQLQTWVNRGHLEIAQPNPGRGKSRHYSELDAVKVAVMVRLNFFGVPVDKAARVAAYAGKQLLERGKIPWDQYFTISFATGDRFGRDNYISAGYDPDHLALNIGHGDAADMKVAQFSEVWSPLTRYATPGVHPRRPDGAVDEDARDRAAAAGLHAEPFLYFPLGEVVNGVIAQVEARRGDGK